MIGDISIFYTTKDECFTIGITISPFYQSNGYAYEILSKVIEKICEVYPSLDIVALIDKDNQKSIALFEKLNFIQESFVSTINSDIYVIYGKKKTK